jgi:hypothetical protein
MKQNRKQVTKVLGAILTLSSYVAIHQQAHQDLERLGEPMPENKKVQDFLQGITDSQCSNIKLNVLSNPNFMN